MIIRSQDRKTIVNFDKITALSLMGKDICAHYNSSEECYNLGNYKTDVDARKVFDYIQKCYLDDCKIYEMPSYYFGID
jgi:hypothetical protein